MGELNQEEAFTSVGGARKPMRKHICQCHGFDGVYTCSLQVLLTLITILRGSQLPVGPIIVNNTVKGKVEDSREDLLNNLRPNTLFSCKTRERALRSNKHTGTYVSLEGYLLAVALATYLLTREHYLAQQNYIRFGHVHVLLWCLVLEGYLLYKYTIYLATYERTLSCPTELRLFRTRSCPPLVSCARRISAVQVPGTHSSNVRENIILPNRTTSVSDTSMSSFGVLYFSLFNCSFWQRIISPTKRFLKMQTSLLLHGSAASSLVRNINGNC
jgi:hypothetical protein